MWVGADEYMKDTEAYIDIELDSSQNRLFRLDIVLTAATFALALFHVVAGLPLLIQMCVAFVVA